MASTPTAQMQAVLDAHAEFGPLPIESLTPESARTIPLPDRAVQALIGHDPIKRALTPVPTPVGAVAHKTIDGPGGELLLRVYTPAGTAPAGGWPVVVYVHGGGWVIASVDVYDGSARALCNGAKAVVVSVNYRFAPEHPFPAAHDDVLAAYRYVAAHAEAFGGAPGRVAIAGESAGGNMAIATAVAVRGTAHAPRHVLAVYPVSDPVNGPSSPSAVEQADAKPLNTAMLHWFYGHLTPDASALADPRLSIVRADLSGLPPVTVVQAEIDPLTSEGTALIEALQAAGVPVASKLYTGVTHEFFGMAGVVDEATEAMAFACERLAADLAA